VGDLYRAEKEAKRCGAISAFDYIMTDLLRLLKGSRYVALVTLKPGIHLPGRWRRRYRG